MEMKYCEREHCIGSLAISFVKITVKGSLSRVIDAVGL